MKMEEERIEAEKQRVKEEAQQLALIFETVGAFKCYRSRSCRHIKEQLQRDVDKRIVSLPEMRETGEYIAELKLHPEVTAREVQDPWKHHVLYIAKFSLIFIDAVAARMHANVSEQWPAGLSSSGKGETRFVLRIIGWSSSSSE
ncbi:hypothetical protein CRYUN_Cryun25bG0090900 [Craigia yunnanensis]